MQLFAGYNLYGHNLSIFNIDGSMHADLRVGHDIEKVVWRPRSGQLVLMNSKCVQVWDALINRKLWSTGALACLFCFRLRLHSRKCKNKLFCLMCVSFLGFACEVENIGWFPHGDGHRLWVVEGKNLWLMNEDGAPSKSFRDCEAVSHCFDCVPLRNSSFLTLSDMQLIYWTGEKTVEDQLRLGEGVVFAWIGALLCLLLLFFAGLMSPPHRS